MTAMGAVNRSMLRDQVRTLLLERIVEGDYGPGDRIVETRVASELRVSQGTVREALRELEALGTVVSEPHRGVRVRAVSADELAEIYPVRAAIEEVAAVSAASALEGDVAALEAEYEAMLRAARRDDLHEMLVHDVRFHRLIVEASGNGILQQVWESLRIEARTLISLIKVGDLVEAAEAHRPVLEALRAGDGPRAGRALRRHVESFAAWLVPARDGA